MRPPRHIPVRHVTERVSDGVWGHDGMLWTRCIARKPGVCNWTRRPFEKGTPVYRPLTNGAARSQRIQAAVWDQPDDRSLTTPLAPTRVNARQTPPRNDPRSTR